MSPINFPITIDDQLKGLMSTCVTYGQKRETRSGDVRGVFRRDITWDMRVGLPFPMSKSLAFNPMMGELLWFITDNTTLSSLRRLSNLDKDAWTIWTNDCERWHQVNHYDADGNKISKDDLGDLYGHQWRNWGGDRYFKKGVDQLQNLVDNMKSTPTSRYLLVQAYNPETVMKNAAALPPCHTGFQVYVDVETGEFDLDWTQRSVDVFLGLPFNIASYAVLMLILGKLTGLTPRYLFGSLKDVHVYEGHLKAVSTQLSRESRVCTAVLELPEFKTLDDLQKFTAKDFKLHGYNPAPAIRAPLLVG